MDDVTKMFQTIINGQSAFRQEVMSKFSQLERKFEKLDGKIDQVEIRLTERLDKIGKQLAFVEDDTPTKEEFEKLEKRVSKLEQPTSV
jgi:predicted ArsR family transcriptional regulator